MRDYAIITDSCSDLPTEIRADLGVDYARMNVVYDGKEYYADIDWKLYSPTEYFNIMRKGTRITTTQVPTEEYVRIFEKYLNEGKDIIYIGCSSALSGSVNTACVVAKEMMEKYPEGKVVCVDSLRSCYGLGILVIKAAELKLGGMSLDELSDWLENNKLTANQLGAVDTLDYLKRAGRVKASAAFFGNVFGVKPIIISDAHGNNYAAKKAKGRKGSFTEIVNMMKETIVDPENQTVYVAHADCLEDAKFLAEEIKKAVNCKDVYIGYIGPIIGASTGPGTVAAYYFGKEVTIVGE